MGKKFDSAEQVDFSMETGIEMSKILVKVETGYRFINKCDIQIVKSENNHSKVYLNEESFMVKKPLAFFEKNLKSDKFIRINRNTIVNIDMIVEMKKNDDDYIVCLNNENTFNWGRKYRQELIRTFK